jgi:3-methylcrotonyl-CoA carboxylase alpha subunit
MLKKILIANRGEIACRVIATARRLGIRTVAVYSDADARAKHVALADEAVRIGPPAVSESYLKGDVIIAAALKTGADGIHPGYGFLSENPEFVEKVQAAGLRFIGPPASAIRAMGLKDAAKKLMVEAGVPVVPGYHGENQQAEFLHKEADRIGYPVLIKARAGGGGKGMRKVERSEDFIAGLEGAQREGQASFGDPAVLIEKYVTRPRHIEIQVFGDDHGNAVYLFERDCSLQRRHQKVIEEAPAPGMPEAMRKAMGEAAVKAAKAIGYSGAGTIEFIVDSSEGLRADRFYFMEMNTRLQVEHPVTEMITGEDLVEWQLRVASGEPLPRTQGELSLNGWSFEARIYAEDAPKGFLPATGTLEYLAFPQGGEFERTATRIDSGVRQGDTITPFYDPMIAKLIVHGPTRDAALGKLATALADCHVAGSVTNLRFLGALATHPGFKAGGVDTGFIERELESLIDEPAPSATVKAVAAISSLGLVRAPGGTDPWATLTAWRLWTAARQFALLEHKGERFELALSDLGHGVVEIGEGEGGPKLRIRGVSGNRLRLDIDGRMVNATVVEHKGRVTVFMDGEIHEFALPDRLATADDGDAGGDKVVSPMPGLIRLVAVKPGDAVAKGDPMIVVEAMKMEHTLRAPRDGVVEAVYVAEGEQIVDGAVLAALEPEAKG